MYASLKIVSKGCGIWLDSHCYYIVLMINFIHRER